MNGIAISLLFIFKEESLSNNWIPGGMSNDWMYSYNSKGRTSNEHGLA